MMQHSCVFDSTKNFLSAKPGSQVVGENAFGQSVCKILQVLIFLKTI